MMKKIIIASHHKLASGFKDTLEYIVPNTVEVLDINAYIDTDTIENEMVSFFEKFDKDEQIFVFTDLLGGSVNQEFVKYINIRNVELIAGMNLPLILSISLAISEGSQLSSEEIQSLVEESKQQIVYVNEYISQQDLDDDDE